MAKAIKGFNVNYSSDSSKNLTDAIITYTICDTGKDYVSNSFAFTVTKGNTVDQELDAIMAQINTLEGL